MLEDPEQRAEEWTDYVWATDEAEARRKCEYLAEKFTQDGESLVTLAGVKRIGRSRKFECKFRG